MTNSSGWSPTRDEIPNYRCHKVVGALKIGTLEYTDDGVRMTPLDEGFGPVTLDFDWVQKHNPDESGYLVVYEDGYQSYSPAEAFESGYTRI